MKKQYCVNLDLESVEIIKARGDNLSAFISSLCEVEAGLIPEEKINEVQKLKLANAKLIDQLKTQKEEYEKKIKKIKEKKEEKVYQRPEDIEWPEVL